MAVVAVTAAQFAITYLPALQTVFATEAVPFLDGILIFAIGVALFAIVETEKQIRVAIRRKLNTH
ncbi:cation transporting ATPase C-terminal domain-containing protein [Rheinheimera sediminis]|uniref:cation transporting ATPase C-terminal domain-containing protein n=1 Tax=Rheinheimera sp. YQF-1 TaxID=2499626 RepID=UPI0039657FCF